MNQRLGIVSLFIFFIFGCKNENLDCEEKVVYLNDSTEENHCYCDKDIQQKYDNAVNEFSAFKLFLNKYTDVPKSEFSLNSTFFVFSCQETELIFYVKKEKNILVWSSKEKILNTLSLENLGTIENLERNIMNSITTNLDADVGKDFFMQWIGADQRKMYALYLQKRNANNLLKELAEILY